MEALVPAILEQKVTGTEAWRAWRGLIRTYSEPAPGPPEPGLRLPPRSRAAGDDPVLGVPPPWRRATTGRDGAPRVPDGGTAGAA